MRFLANGPSIPDDLLIARDAGDVIFFCGAGVSRHRAGLPDFLKLGGDVIDILGAGEKSLARKLFLRIKALDPIDGVGGLIATDRIFSLLEREFEQRDVQRAVARAIKPADDADASAHRTLIDLSRGRDGTVRLVTTNFDLLFEAAAPGIACSGPPALPDPRSAEFGGIVHLHGRVNGDYSGPGDEEFIVSSADFGRAYLSDGWATRFMQSLLARFQIVFVGYGADDPPVQYLLEALNLHAGNRSRLFAFQPGSNADDAALWEHRGVRAIPFNNSQNFDPLWDSLGAWAERARDVDGWYAGLLERAAVGPAALDPHVRGQIAHMLSTREGARRVSIAEPPLPASWLLALDPRQRFDKPGPVDPYGESGERIDPYESLALDFDTPPQPVDEGDDLRDRPVPEGSWSAFAPTRFDQDDAQDASFGDFCGDKVTATGALSTRLGHLAIWFHSVAHQPIALWWAAARGPLHPRTVDMIQAWLRQDPDRWPDDIRRGWRFLIASWSDRRVDPNHGYYELSTRVARDGWSQSLVRDYAALFRPRLKVDRKFGIPHPLSWTENDRPNPLLQELRIAFEQRRSVAIAGPLPEQVRVLVDGGQPIGHAARPLERRQVVVQVVAQHGPVAAPRFRRAAGIVADVPVQQPAPAPPVGSAHIAELVHAVDQTGKPFAVLDQRGVPPVAERGPPAYQARRADVGQRAAPAKQRDLLAHAVGRRSGTRTRPA